MRPKRPLTPGTLGAEVQKIHQLLLEGSDLAVALIATSFLDECLRSLLAAHFRSRDTADALLRSGRGVLGTYSARTDLAYCLSLIDSHALKAMRGAGEVRNAFAHSYAEASFEDAEIQPLVERLDYAYELPSTSGPRQLSKDSIKAELDRFFAKPRNRFTYTCVLLGQTIIPAAQQAETAHPRKGV